MHIRRSLAAGLAAALLSVAPAAFAQEAPPAPPGALDQAIDLMNTDPAAAYAIFERLANEGDAEAKNGVAAILEHGAEGVPADPERAARLLREAAEQGSDGARLNLGISLLMNDEASDDADAVAMLNRITHEGLSKMANWPLGRAYLFGAGVDQDLGRGARMMMVAVDADPSNIDAQFLLGRAHQNGWGIPKDPVAGFRHLKVAADAGDERAQWNVGMMLLEGNGTPRDAVQARRYVSASAESSYLDGMISMAVMHALGQGGPVDAVRSREWYQRAADAGSAHALRGLGGMLMTGEGGPVDRVTGAAYLDIAAKAGDPPAARMQQMFASEIVALDRAEVEAVKSRWLRAHGTAR